MVNCPQRFQNWPNLTVYYKRVVTTMQIAVTINFETDLFIERYHVYKYSYTLTEVWKLSPENEPENLT